jgi:hypothetical protein
MTALYVSAEGILDPLGFSQVFRVVSGLAARGRRYVLLTMERPDRLARRERVEHLRSALAALDVEWSILPFRAGGGRAAAENLARLVTESFRLIRRHRVRLVHARAYHGATVGLAARAALGVPYLFDARGYWIDERAEEGRQFASARSYRLGKAFERTLYQRASGIVTLTALQAEDLRAGRVGRLGPVPIEVITTTADFDEFKIERGPRPAALAPLGDGPLLGWIGSFNGSYLLEPSLALMRAFLAMRHAGGVVFITAQQEQARAFAGRAGLDAARVVVCEVPHHDMPRWVPHLDACALFLKSSFAKRASMPTKLAELLAAGVAPIHFGCNDEVSRWVKETGSGISLPDLEPESIERAARSIVPRDAARAAILDRARLLAAPHFSLSGAIERYDRLLATLGVD